jgi:hypothetical protein
LRRLLTKEGIRRPQLIEFRVSALAGIAALGANAGDTSETRRQSALLEEWYELLAPVREDDIDEPDFEERAVEVQRLEQERAERRREIYPQIAAIEANLERHWPAYRDLLADRQYWDDISAIEMVRLLLARREPGGELARDEDGMLTDSAYRSVPRADRPALAGFATGLLHPSEDERKN